MVVTRFSLLLIAVLFTPTVHCRHFRISTIVSEPFFFDMSTVSGETVQGGYCVDLIEKLHTILNFTYSFHVVADDAYGAPRVTANGTEEWVGMIGEVVNGVADMAVADLTITPLRSTVVTFTAPFLNAELGMIYRKRENEFGWWTFVLPFSWQVWFLIFGSLIATALCLFVMAHVHEEDSHLRSLSGCVYFTLACLFAQGPESYPRTISSRIVASCWWFLSLMLLVLYTADLTSTFTIDKGELAVENLEDLLTLPEVHFGIVKDTAIQETFKFTEFVPFQMMWQRMISFPEMSLAETYRTGLQKAQENDDFIFIDETPNLEYMVGQPPCTVNMISGSNSPKTGGGYGFALPQTDWQWVNKFSVELIRMHQTGYLAELHRKWYDMRSLCNNNKVLSTSEAGNINLDKMKGIFVFFGAGLAAALVHFGMTMAMKPVRGKLGSTIEKSVKGSF